MPGVQPKARDVMNGPMAASYSIAINILMKESVEIGSHVQDLFKEAYSPVGSYRGDRQLPSQLSTLKMPYSKTPRFHDFLLSGL